MLKQLLEQFKNGKLNRDIDEKYSGGVYDFAIEYVYNYYYRNILPYSGETENINLDIDNVIEIVYNVVYDILEGGE